MELAQLFTEQRPALVQELRDALQTKNGASLRRAAHTLKGSVALFAAQEATRLSAVLEKMGREGSFEGAEDALAALEAELDLVEKELASAKVLRGS